MPWGVCTSLRIYDNDHDGPISIGFPFPGTTNIILNKQLSQLMPIGCPGVLCISGYLMSGYLNNDALTKEKIIHHPTYGTLYNTGDLAKLQFTTENTLELFFEGRMDHGHQIKYFGQLIRLDGIAEIFKQHPLVQDAHVVANTTNNNQIRFLVYVVYQKGANIETSSSKEVVWDEIFNDTVYKQFTPGIEYNYSGWQSVITQKEIPITEMEQWLEATVANIDSQGQCVFEIGCGTGLIMRALAANKQNLTHYYATDISTPVIKYLAESLTQFPLKTQSEVKILTDTISAAEIDWHKYYSDFDMIIMNSVVQYFPSEEYFITVLDKIIASGKLKGKLFIGDIRNLDLVDCLYLEIALYKFADSDYTIEQLMQFAKMLALKESELLLSPHFFSQLTAKFPSIIGVRYELKHCVSNNELTKYRYDLLMFLEGQPVTYLEDITTHRQSITWNENITIDVLSSTLDTFIQDTECEVLQLLDVEDPRFTQIQVLLDIQYRQTSAKEMSNTYQLNYPSEINFFEQIDKLARKNNINLFYTFASSGHRFCFDVIFYKNKDCLLCTKPIPMPTANQTLINEPSLATKLNCLCDDLYQHFQKHQFRRVPISDILIMDEFPVNSHGKLDIARLPPSEKLHYCTPVVSPRNQLQTDLLKIWREIIGGVTASQEIGIRHNFFVLGGHSILLSKIVNIIRKQLHLEISPEEIYNHPTVEALSARINSLQSESETQPQNPVTKYPTHLMLLAPPTIINDEEPNSEEDSDEYHINFSFNTSGNQNE